MNSRPPGGTVGGHNASGGAFVGGGTGVGGRASSDGGRAGAAGGLVEGGSGGWGVVNRGGEGGVREPSPGGAAGGSLSLSANRSLAPCEGESLVAKIGEENIKGGFFVEHMQGVNCNP